MAERGIGKRHAYALLRRLNEANAGPVPDNQRDRLLAYLYRSGGESRNVTQMVEELHAEGYRTDGHDVTKVLWSLQKTGHVHFRERQNPKTLYAIRLTEAGTEAARALPAKLNGQTSEPVEPALVENPVTGWHQEASVEEEEEQPTETSYRDMRLVAHARGNHERGYNGFLMRGEEVVVIEPCDHRHPDTTEAYYCAWGRYPTEEDRIARPWVKGNLGGWPAIRSVRDRARTARKLTQAAKLLEEAGEDDMALTLMGKTEFTDLEREIINLLEAWEEMA